MKQYLCRYDNFGQAWYYLEESTKEKIIESNVL